jgi:hypothetical protein
VGRQQQRSEKALAASEIDQSGTVWNHAAMKEYDEDSFESEFAPRVE